MWEVRLTFVGPGTVSNRTIQRLHTDGGVADRTGSAGGLVFRYDTIDNVSRGYAYYFYAEGSSLGSYTQRGVQIHCNQIDHVGACLEVDGGSRMAFGFTFSHNVRGPGVGAGAVSGTWAAHYIQVGGISGMTVRNNAFLGPMDPGYQAAQLHNNVLHVFGDASGIDFSGNLIVTRSHAAKRSSSRRDGSTMAGSTTTWMSKIRPAMFAAAAAPMPFPL